MSLSTLLIALYPKKSLFAPETFMYSFSLSLSLSVSLRKTIIMLKKKRREQNSHSLYTMHGMRPEKAEASSILFQGLSNSYSSSSEQNNRNCEFSRKHFPTKHTEYQTVKTELASMKRMSRRMLLNKNTEPRVRLRNALYLTGEVGVEIARERVKFFSVGFPRMRQFWFRITLFTVLENAIGGFSMEAGSAPRGFSCSQVQVESDRVKSRTWIRACFCWVVFQSR